MLVPLRGVLTSAVARLEKEKKALDFEVERIEKKLANPGFVTKAPPAVVREERDKLDSYRSKRELVLKRLADLRGE